ncbi:hypothetical protein GGR16_003754 [Chelatococcus caeni]|uniref:FkbM family methyltransferase n=1 Tax=Chelatococcus caeni TaxID=1348468 RepID=A0A840C8P5_9HYPH|nr:hypothetical protein [Chelatococcus caeni]MBB4018707.1 hypothetical protein [Chelatococcus caeni]
MIRATLKQHAPFLMRPWRALRRHAHRLRYGAMAAHVERHARGRIMGGPFAGLRFPDSGIGGSYYAQIVGTYEAALVPVIEDVIARAPAAVIDVGAAYGYYALGLAHRLPGVPVIAYEMDATRAALLARYRSLNGLDGAVDIRGECTPEALEAALAATADTFVLMDVEGAEADLLDPAQVPALARTEILVELHEMFVPGVTAMLQARFARSHTQTLVAACYPEVATTAAALLARTERQRAQLRAMLTEKRGAPMTWLHCVPKPAAAGGSPG